MLFNSLTFVFFAVGFYLLWPLLKKRNQPRWAYLTVASFVFYGWWDWRFLFLIVFSGLVDYCAALGIERWPVRKKVFLAFSLVGNIGSLVLFKYSGFVATNIDYFLQRFGMDVGIADSIPKFYLIVPVGISFYTFQSMSYTIDVYRGNLKPTRDVLHFFAYLSMFPQLVAGPIVRACDLLPQLRDVPKTTEADQWEGTKLIIYGYFKKMVIADNIGLHVNMAFQSHLGEPQGVYWWMIMVFFAVQVYCDFSGYSDIARGLARWMGYQFPLNFNFPYIATSLRDFWSRWHISLTSWFKDYVFMPIIFLPRRGKVWSNMRVYIALWATFVLSGLWHGAGWGFVLLGVWHSLFMSIEQATKYNERISRWAGGKIILWAGTMGLVLLSFVFFRSETVGGALDIMGSMLAFSGDWVPAFGRSGLIYLVLFVFFETCMYWLEHKPEPAWERSFVGWAATPALWAAVALLCVFCRGTSAEFIYFRF